MLLRPRPLNIASHRNRRGGLRVLNRYLIAVHRNAWNGRIGRSNISRRRRHNGGSPDK
jgi:hypothetical protein